MFLSTYTLVESEYTQFRQRARYMFCPPVPHADKISDKHEKKQKPPLSCERSGFFLLRTCPQAKER